MVVEKNSANGKVISKCKNNKPWENYIEKVSDPSPILGRPAPAPYFQPF